MLLAVQTIFLLIPLTVSSIGAFFPKSTPHPIDLNHEMVTLLNLCYREHLNPLIIAGKYADFYSQILQQSNVIPVILINNGTMQYNIRQQHLKSNVFVMISDTTNELSSSFESLRLSNFWNTNGTYLITGNCENAADFLNVAWNVNLLSSLFVCVSLNKQVIFYTYNPFTNRAPMPWKKVHNEISDERWTLYSRPFIRVSNFCDELNFDKTKYLDGYKIRAISVNYMQDKIVPGKLYDIHSISKKLYHVRAQYYLTLFPTLNVTPVISYDLHRNSTDPSEAENYLNSNNNESYDMILTFTPIAIGYGRNVTGTRTYSEATYMLITQHRGFLSTTERVSLFFSTGTTVYALAGIIIIISFFTFRIYKNIGYSLALFYTLQLMLSKKFFKLLDTTFMKLFFIPIFVFFITLRMTLQGNVISILTKSEHRKDVESIQDLLKLNFSIYVTASVSQMVMPENIGKAKISHSVGYNCSDFVKHNTTTACIGYVGFLLPAVLHSRWHFKKIKAPMMQHFHNWVRKDWPLTRRIDKINAKLSRSGLPMYWRKKMVDEPLQKLNMRIEGEEASKARELSVNDLFYAFVLLIIGLGLGTTVFIIEILQKRYILQWKIQ